MTVSKDVSLLGYTSELFCISGLPSNQASFAIPHTDTLWASLKVFKAIKAFKQ